MRLKYLQTNLREISLLGKSRLVHFFFIFLFFAYITPSYSLQIKVLHTNDLHGFIENTGFKKDVGGFARLKYKMDSLEKEAQKQQISTLKLDAGDFLEGSLFYTVNQGRDLMNLMGEMGYDAVAVGNHDFQMGTKELNDLLREVPPKFAYLASNMRVKRKYQNDYKYLNYIKPYQLIKREGKTIAVLGVTTNERFYRWQFSKGIISDPIRSVKHHARFLKRELNVDQVWVLSHIGKDKDVELARKSKYVDLIIGGHSHTALFKPLNIKNKRGRIVPVVQAGSLGHFLGELSVNINDDNILNVTDYKLHELNEPFKDKYIDKYVQKIRRTLNDHYGKEFLKEHVAHSHKPLIQSDYRHTFWTQMITDSFRESTGADVSLYSPSFKGANIPSGEVSREDIMNSHPRFFSMKDKWGWRVYTLEIDGYLLTRILKEALQRDFPLVFSGVDIKVEKNSQMVEPPLVREIENIEEFQLLEMMDLKKEIGSFFDLLGEDKVHKLKINGEKIYNFRNYTVALNEGMVVGGLQIGDLLFDTLTMNVQETDFTVWQAIESYAKEKLPLEN